MRNAITNLALAFLALASCSGEEQRTAPATELSALDIPNLAQVDASLASAGQPSEEQFAKLAGAGYRSAISLRPATESGAGWEEARAAELGLRFVRIPIAGADDLTEENARALDQALRAAGDEKTLVYCASGNRVGGLLALRAHFVQGMKPDEALAYGMKAGLTRAEPTVREKLGLAEGD